MSRHDDRSPEEIEADIQRVRSRMNDTINAIENKLSPGQLIDQTMHYLRHNGAGEFASNLGATVKQKPVPVTLVGIGLGWLMMAQRPDRGMTSDSGDARATADGAKAKAESLAGGAQDKMSGLAQETRKRMARIKSGTQASAGNASYQARRAKTQFTHMMQEQPLIMGVLGIALGAAVGAALAPTRHEDELMGEARDDVVDKASEVGQRGSEKLGSTAQAATEAASRQASKEGLTSTGAEAAPDHQKQEPVKKDVDTPEPAPNRVL